MIQYLLATTICWLFFLLAYGFIFRKVTFYKYNRIYLLSSFVLGMILPFISKLIKPTETFEIVRAYVVPELLIPTNISSTEVDSWSISWWIIIYSIGVVVSSSKLMNGLFKIYRHYNTGEKIRKDRYTIVQTKRTHLPFSFFKYIFISKKIPLNQHLAQVLEHEEAHIDQWHTLDILLIECMQIILWFHPLIYFYKKAIKQSHEFYADAYATRDFSKQDYSKLLVAQSTTGIEISLANHFFHSNIKDRLMMIQKSKTSKSSILLYFLAIPIVGILLFSFSPNRKKPNQNLEKITVVGFGNTDNTEQLDEEPLELTQKDEAFLIVEQMPQFPGCESEEKSTQEQCAKTELLKYVYGNIKYPKEDRKNGVSGTAVSQFVVDKNGTIKNIEIVRSVSKTIDAEVYRMLEDMGDKVTWIPGKQSGKKVDVKFTLPVKFVLEDGETQEREKEESLDIDFSIYPNPTSDILSFKSDNIFKNPLTVTVYDKTGVVLLTTNLKSINDQVSVREIPSGDYVLMITDGKRKTAKNFTKN